MNTVTWREWLDFFGFKTSPFESKTAAVEKPEMWVPPVGFDRILSEPQTVLVFAPRGGGKTACRRLMEYYCSPQVGSGDLENVGERVLTIPYADFKDADRFLRSGRVVDVVWHVEQILKHAAKCLIDYTYENEETKEQLQKAVKSLTPACRQELFLILGTYLPWKSQVDLLKEIFPLSTSNADYIPTNLSPMAYLEQFVALMCSTGSRGLGFSTVYVLIDSLDQTYETADLGQDAIIRLILPLIANRHLMCDIPQLAFKWFLPLEVRDRLLRNPSISNSGLREEEIRWFDWNIGDILHRRLRSHKIDESDNSFTQFEALCAPDLRGVIETLLFEVTGGNPRDVIRLCERMVDVHVEQSVSYGTSDTEDIFLLNRFDWSNAKKRFEVATQREQSSLMLDTSASMGFVTQEIEAQGETASTAQTIINIAGDGNIVGDGSKSKIKQGVLPSFSRAKSQQDISEVYSFEQSILLVMANPKDSAPLHLLGEDRVIEDCLHRGLEEGRIVLKRLPAATSDDLRKAVLNGNFTILHFSGHGWDSKIYLEKEDGSRVEVSLSFFLNEYLARVKSIRCIVLNTCYTNTELISVDRERYVIATNDKILDEAAIEFSRGFYDAINAGKAIRFAFQEGCYAMIFAGYEEESKKMVLRSHG